MVPVSPLLCVPPGESMISIIIDQMDDGTWYFDIVKGEKTLFRKDKLVSRRHAQGFIAGFLQSY